LVALLKDAVPVQAVLGTQWGDEGKGKVVDLLGETADIVARYQGGPNAGHTVEFDGECFILHHIPTGILRPHITCVIGNGLVINPDSFQEEIAFLKGKGISIDKRLWISQNAHLILPYHHLIEKVAEEDKGSETLGTTGRGIGPAYADKASRVGIRVGDLLDPGRLAEKVAWNVQMKNGILEDVGGKGSVNVKSILDSLRYFGERIKACITDTSWMLHQEIQKGKRLLVEGAQGTLLDIDFGTYPFVTSSNTTIGGMATGLGLPPRKLDRIIGVIKAYTTRVGNGPLPTELKGAMGEKIREMGGEYGATTGRPRRCGWFDGMVAQYAVRLNGIDVLAVTKLDVLDTLDEVQVCIGYEYRGKALDHFPLTMSVLDEVEPIYDTMPGWKTTISDFKRYDDLPKPARDYLERIQTIAGIPIGIVSVGANRDQTIWME